jgi:hypothetical protein
MRAKSRGEVYRRQRRFARSIAVFLRRAAGESWENHSNLEGRFVGLCTSRSISIVEDHSGRNESWRLTVVVAE